jgi:hypothetical protein
MNALGKLLFMLSMTAVVSTAFADTPKRVLKLTHGDKDTLVEVSIRENDDATTEKKVAASSTSMFVKRLKEMDGQKEISSDLIEKVVSARDVLEKFLDKLVNCVNHPHADARIKDPAFIKCRGDENAIALKSAMDAIIEHDGSETLKSLKIQEILSEVKIDKSRRRLSLNASKLLGELGIGALVCEDMGDMTRETADNGAAVYGYCAVQIESGKPRENVELPDLVPLK